MRAGDDWTDDDAETIEAFADRGFTGHEHLPSVFGLIDMNGRMYDSKLGRFLSADPYVQAPGYSQSYNRYAYCFNNPLIYTDPSGYQSMSDSEKYTMSNGGGSGISEGSMWNSSHWNDIME